MLPLFKVFSLVVRVFSRPLINYTKRYHIGRKADSHDLLRRFFIFVGNYYNRLETKINKKFLKIPNADEIFVKPLSDDVAIEKGVEFFYEIVLYSILISLPLYEMWQAQESANQKNKELAERLDRIESDIKVVREKEAEDDKALKDRIDQLERTISKNDKTTTEIANELNLLRLDIQKYIDIKMAEHKLLPLPKKQ